MIAKIPQLISASELEINWLRKPLRMIARVPKLISGTDLEMNWLLKPFRLIGKVREFISGTNLEMNWALIPFRMIAKAPKFFFGNDLVLHWVETRPQRPLIYGTPALFVACIMVGITIYAKSIEKQVSTRPLLRKAIIANSMGNQGLAKLYIAKAGPLNTGNSATKLDNARLLIAAGRTEQGLTIIQGMTPTNAVGFPPAREALIRALQYQLKTMPTAPEAQPRNEITSPGEKQSEAEAQILSNKTHLVRAIQAQCEQLIREKPDSRLAQNQLAGLYLRQGRLEDACKMLAKLVEHSEDLRSLYARALARANKPIRAKNQAEIAAQFHRKQLAALESSPGPDANGDRRSRYYHLSRLCLSLTLSQDYRDAALLLINDLRKDEMKDPVLRSLLVDVLLTWADSMKTMDEQTEEIDESLLGYRLMLLEVALNYSAGDPRLLARIGSIAGIEGASSEKARASLRKIADSGNANPTVHFALGISAIKNGDLRNAISHFESANEKSPGTPAMMNNLAFSMAQGENADLEQALKLISGAIEVDPDNPELHDTRGMILVKQAKWQAAEKSLRFAVEKGVQDMRSAYKNLISTHQALGNQEQVKAYREKLEALSD